MSTPGSTFWMKCQHCGATNRVGRAHVGAKGRCGQCGELFHAVDCIPSVATDRTWDAEVLGSELPVIAEIWSPTCSVCGQYAPQVRRMAAELCGRVRVVQLNAAENPGTANRYYVRGVPTVLLFRGGKLVQGLTGAQPKEALLRALGI